MTRYSRALLAGVLLCGAAAASLPAQDTYFSRITYGTEATLLGGAVVGRATDLSTLFYNPAGLAAVEDPTILLTAKVYEYNVTKAQGQDAQTGEPYNLGSGTIRPAPTFFGGTVPFKGLGKHRLGYSVMSRAQHDDRIALRVPREFDAMPGSPGEERVASELLLVNQTTETWVGASWAVPLADNLLVGASMFVAVRDQLRRNQLTSEALASDGEIGLASGITEYDYNYWRLVPKVGAMMELAPVTIGAAVTLPSAKLWGGGQALFNVTSTGLDLDADGVPDNQYVVSYQNGLGGTFKNGWAVGLGAAVILGNTSVYVSGDWYAPIETYAVLETAPFTGQTTGEVEEFPMLHTSNEVLNVSVGVRQRFSPRLAGYVHYATDQASSTTPRESNVGTGYWDLNHLGGGAQFGIGQLNLVLGATYTWGGDRVPLRNLSDNPLLLNQALDVTQRGIRFLIGLQYGFGGRSGAAGEAE